MGKHGHFGMRLLLDFKSSTWGNALLKCLDIPILWVCILGEFTGPVYLLCLKARRGRGLDFVYPLWEL